MRKHVGFQFTLKYIYVRQTLDCEWLDVPASSLPLRLDEGTATWSEELRDLNVERKQRNSDVKN